MTDYGIDNVYWQARRECITELAKALARLDDAVRLRNVENLLARWEREADDA